MCKYENAYVCDCKISPEECILAHLAGNHDVYFARGAACGYEYECVCVSLRISPKNIVLHIWRENTMFFKTLFEKKKHCFKKYFLGGVCVWSVCVCL